MKPPSNTKELQAFIGQISYIRRFVPGLAQLMTALLPLLKKNTPFVWGEVQRAAFEKLKQCLVSPKILRPPIQGIPLYLYTTFTGSAIGAVLAQDMGGNELSPIYYVSRVIRDADLRYPHLEQACLAFIYATQKLRPYLLTHETIVVAAENPIAYLASKPFLTGRTARWLLQLSEFELKYQRLNAVRGQAIADLVAMFTGEGDDEVHEYVPGEVEAADVEKPWTMFFDGLSYGTVGGAGVVFEAPRGEFISYSFKLDFPCSNNVAEYEVLILGLRMAKEINLGSIEVKGDSRLVTNQVNGDFHLKEPHLAPYRAEAQRLTSQTGLTLDHTGRGGNKHADALATLASKVQLNGEEEGTVTIKRKDMPSTWKENMSFEEADDWRRVYIEDLTRMDEERVIPVQALKQFVMIRGALYYRAAGGSLARCVNKREAEKLLQELHAETCRQTGVVHLYRKLQRMGVYWPSMSAQASALQDNCVDCQAPPQPAKVCTVEKTDWRQPYVDFIQHRRLPSDKQAALKIQKKAARFFIHEGVLYRISYGNAALRVCQNMKR
ncbi:uncharacterized protein LOC113350893 [Papaver somniferum]|uniref:uncharacterized protein LOC113350893 n=1 Tax=Papaver somniferum TaxID=3469 RepID=UPI000E6FEC2F|nr:uncharacterized protein LOC113350893 [Papaver somniferum]